VSREEVTGRRHNMIVNVFKLWKKTPLMEVGLTFYFFIYEQFNLFLN